MTGAALSPALLPLHDGREIGNIGELLTIRAEQDPGQRFLAFESEEFSYAEFDRLTNRLARGFQSAGVAAGDRVCVLLPNCPEMLLIWLGLAKLGAVWVPINIDYKGDALVRMIESTGARLAIVHQEFRDTMLEALERTVGLDTLHWIGEDAPTGARHRAFTDLMHEDSSAILVPVGPSAPLMFLFTSGSTGAAKPVIISHGFALHTAGELIEHVGYGPEDVMFTPFPLFHGDATMLSVLPALISGTTVAVSRRFSVRRFLPEVRAYGATVMTAMGTVVSYLLNSPELPDDAENPLRVAIAGAVPESVGDFERRFGVRFVALYGSTECCIPAFNLSLPHEQGMGGQICEHHDVNIVDDEGSPVAAGEVGEILVRGLVPHAHMSGYHGNPEATVAAWRDLWYHTGDLGRLSDGTLRFAGRKKDVIRRRGENIPATEVESAFEAHPAVLMCAAIAVPSDIVEDEVKVVVELVEHLSAEPVELIAFVRERLPAHMVPRYLEIVEALPRTQTGKTNKVALRAQWQTPDTTDFDAQAR